MSVLARVPVEVAEVERIRVTVASLLANRGHEVRVDLVVSEGVEEDVEAGLRQHYREEPRVRCVRAEEEPDPETAFVLRVRPGIDLATDAVHGMVRVAKKHEVALVRSVLSEDDLGGPRLERVCDGSSGVYWLDGEQLLAPHARQEDAPGITDEEMTEPPEGWEPHLERLERETDAFSARATRLRRRYRGLTRTWPGRLLLRLLR